MPRRRGPPKNETPEEKEERLKKEALKAEEARKRKEQEQRAALKEQMMQEAEFSRKNRLKIIARWRKIMRDAKLTELKESLEILAQNHEREVDRKDAILQMLDRDLMEAEEQYQMALRSHLQNVDSLINLQTSRLKTLKDEFDQELASLKKEFGTERELIVGNHAEDRQEVLDTMAAMEQEYQYEEAEAQHVFQSTRDDIKNKNSEEFSALRITLEQIIDELEKHFEEAHQSYITTTEASTTTFRILTAKDDKSFRVIEDQMRRLQKLTEQLSHVKTKMSNNVRECEERNRALKEEKNAIAAHFQRLKKRMNRFREAQKRRLTELTLNSDKAERQLFSHLSVAERCLKLAEMNRKLETEQEKVLPFYDPSPIDEAEAARELAEAEREAAASGAEGLLAKMIQRGEDAEEALERRPGEEGFEFHSRIVDENGEEIMEWDALTKFYQRHAKVILDRMMLEREQSRLSTENKRLRKALKQYLDGVGVSDEILREDNPLFVVNGRSNVAPRSREGRQARVPVVVDAGVVVRQQRL